MVKILCFVLQNKLHITPQIPWKYVYMNRLDTEMLLNRFISAFSVHDGERGPSWTCQSAGHRPSPVCTFTYNASCLQVRKPVYLITALCSLIYKSDNKNTSLKEKKGRDIWGLNGRKLKRKNWRRPRCIKYSFCI